MTKEETIKMLQSIEDRAVDFPYMTACDWVAIAAAKRHLENSINAKWPVSEDLEEAAIEYCGGNKGSDARVRTGFIVGAKWQKEQILDSNALLYNARMEGIEIGKDEIMSKVKRCLDKVDIDSDDCYEQVNDCYDNLCEMIKKEYDYERKTERRTAETCSESRWRNQGSI